MIKTLITIKIKTNGCLIKNDGDGEMFLSHIQLAAIEEALKKTRAWYNKMNISDLSIKTENDRIFDEQFKGYVYEVSKPSLKNINQHKHLYLIHDTLRNTFKIGVTKNVKARLKQLQTGNSSKLICVGYLHLQGFCESSFHEEFKYAHISGEWFEKCNAIEDKFKSHPLFFTL